MEYSKIQFERLYKEYYRLMYRMAFSWLEDSEGARDAVSQVFTKLWQKKPEIPDAAEREYLLAMVRNQCVSMLRQSQRHSRMESEWKSKECRMQNAE